ncbi:MAG: putative metal-dependent hydrolase [Saprospiraceae bacterium]|nr:putative metal-dependent hydrolase [Pyrinomonadaceae bacterium]
MTEDLSYPIGKFDPANAGQRTDNIKAISDLPLNIANAVSRLSEDQLDMPYRPEGWTVRQTVHHVADSHLNSLIRFKLALTEDKPTIRPYYEDRWAELADSKMPVEVSLKIIDGLHSRWTNLLQSMSDADFARRLIHPESGEWTLEKLIAMYAWHGRHHTAHITKLRERKAW